jgi:hypothetical protein
MKTPSPISIAFNPLQSPALKPDRQELRLPPVLLLAKLRASRRAKAQPASEPPPGILVVEAVLDN